MIRRILEIQSNQRYGKAAIEAEQALHRRSNKDDTPIFNTDSNSSANVTTEDDTVSITSSNNEVESKVSEQTTTLPDTTVPLDPKIELNLAKEHIRQDLVEQVQSELARAQESMDDKSETSVTETQASSSIALDNEERYEDIS